MAQVMTPSHTPMTDGQIDKAVTQYRDMLRKHAHELGSDAVQQMLGSAEYLQEQLVVIRKRAEVVSNLLIRRVKVDRSRTPQAMLDATHRAQYTEKSVVKTIPKGERDEVEVFFFKLGRYVSDDELEKEYALRGLEPADPYSLAAVNEADPAFADESPNGTHWKDKDDRWCFATFSRWYGKRSVGVSRNDHDWSGRWWFAGVRK